MAVAEMMAIWLFLFFLYVVFSVYGSSSRLLVFLFFRRSHWGKFIVGDLKLEEVRRYL